MFLDQGESPVLPKRAHQREGYSHDHTERAISVATCSRRPSPLATQ